MQHPRTRRVQRIRLPQPIRAHFGPAEVQVVDLSVLGARIEHSQPLRAGVYSHLSFVIEGEALTLDCRVVRSRLDSFSVGTDGTTLYHSGLEFENPAPEETDQLKRVIGGFIARALEEQKQNARGTSPAHDPRQMPIFRGSGTQPGARNDSPPGSPARSLRESGYICYQLERETWRKKRTHDPGQPAEGFTISALEDAQQAELLCEAYRTADVRMRRVIQLFAQLSIMNDESAAAPRFAP